MLKTVGSISAPRYWFGLFLRDCFQFRFKRINIFAMEAIITIGVVIFVIAMIVCVTTGAPTWVGFMVGGIIVGIFIIAALASGNNKSSNSQSSSHTHRDYHVQIDSEPRYQASTPVVPVQNNNASNSGSGFSPLVTEKKLRSYVSPAVFKRAWNELYRPKHVGKITKSGNSYSASVLSAEGYLSYSVSAVIQKGEIVSHECTCPAHAKYGQPCKHVIAMVLQLNVSGAEEIKKTPPTVQQPKEMDVVQVDFSKSDVQETKPYCPPEFKKKEEAKDVVIKKKDPSPKRLTKPVKVGDVVYHASFGNGKVMNVKDSLIWVSFPDVGTKIFENPGAFEKGFLKKTEPKK